MSVTTVIKSIQDIMRKDAGVDGDAQRIGQLGWMLFLKIFDDQEQELEVTQDGYKSPIPRNFVGETGLPIRRASPVKNSRSSSTRTCFRP